VRNFSRIFIKNDRLVAKTTEKIRRDLLIKYLPCFEKMIEIATLAPLFTHEALLALHFYATKSIYLSYPHLKLTCKGDSLNAIPKRIS
jgi:hypothetical protein